MANLLLSSKHLLKAEKWTSSAGTKQAEKTGYTCGEKKSLLILNLSCPWMQQEELFIIHGRFTNVTTKSDVEKKKSTREKLLHYIIIHRGSEKRKPQIPFQRQNICLPKYACRTDYINNYRYIQCCHTCIYFVQICWFLTLDTIQILINCA